ncbi:MAG: protein kinase [Terriglobales bacterium]
MPAPSSRESREPGPLTGTQIGRFIIGERLGAGGMGEVYRAQDTKLNRSVAIKRLSGNVRSDPSHQRRFVKEAERASQLNDPHIAALYDILEEQGELFLVMEFVEGANLRQHLANGTTLKDFIGIAIQAAEGLRSAHEQHIVHCDIKPENIMISSSGVVKILDFGLARQLAQRDGGVRSLTTATAGLSGTVGYMSPEVMLEEMPDPRSDIFALGVVFYEALSGQHPFLKRTAFETADSVIHAEPPPLHSHGVPSQLSDIVARMMAKEPAQRYPTSDELVNDLKSFAQVASPELLPKPVSETPRPVPARRGIDIWSRTKRYRRWASVFIVILIVALLSRPAIREARRLGRVLGWSKAPQIAVLPFQTIGGVQPDQAFAEGLSDVITSELTRLSNRYVLQVVPANEVRSEKVTSANAARQQFGVDLVVEGSIQPVANMIRATYAVVDAQSGRQVQAGTITVPAGDPFALQDELANSIVVALGIDVSAAERADWKTRATAVPAAYHAYLQGRGYLQDYQKQENLSLAIESFNRALRYDSSYALAYAGLGEAHWHKYEEMSDPAEISDATLACQRALAIDADLVEGNRCLGQVYRSSGKYQEAAEQLEMAIAKRPTDDESVRALGRVYGQLQQFDKAEATYRHAIALRPHYWAGYNWLGGFYASRGQYAKALEMFRKVVEIAPDNYRGYSNAGGIYVLQGKFSDAIPQLERSVQIMPSFAGYSNLGTAYFFERRFQEAVAAYSRAVRLSDQYYVPWGNLGDAQYFTPGEMDSSQASYHKAIELAEQQLKVNAKDADALGYLAVYSAMLHRDRDAEDYLQRALALKPAGPDIWWHASVVYAQLGRTDKTLAAIQSALAAGLSSTYITAAPYFDNLHSDARFQQLIKSAQSLERN